MMSLFLVPGLIAGVASVALSLFMLSVGARLRRFEPRAATWLMIAAVVSILSVVSSCSTFGLVSFGFSMTAAGVATMLAYGLYTATVVGQVAALCWATVVVGRTETHP